MIGTTNIQIIGFILWDFNRGSTHVINNYNSIFLWRKPQLQIPNSGIKSKIILSKADQFYETLFLFIHMSIQMISALFNYK